MIVSLDFLYNPCKYCISRCHIKLLGPYLLLSLGLLLFPGAASGQAPPAGNPIDSLQRLLSKPLADTLRVQVYNQLSYYSYQASQTGKAMQYAQQSLSLARKIGYKQGAGEALRNLGSIYSQQNQYKQSIAYNQEALKFFREVELPLEQAKVLYRLGFDYTHIGNYPVALQCYQGCLELLKVLAGKNTYQKTFQADVLMEIATIYQVQEEFKQALHYIQQATTAYQVEGDSVGLVITYQQMGTLHRALANYQLSLHFFNKSLMHCNVLLAQSEKYFSETRYLQSAKHYAYLSIGQVHILQARFAAALPLVNKALQYYTRANEQGYVAACLIELTKAHQGLHQYQIAYQYIHRGIKIAASIGEQEDLLNGYEILAKLKEDQHDYQGALQAFKQAGMLKDSLFNAQKHKQLLLIENQYKNHQQEQKLLQKQRQVEQLEQERKNARLQLYLLVGMVTGIGGIGWLLFKQYRLRQQLNQAQVAASHQAQVAAMHQAQIDTQNQLELKNRESASYSLHLVQKNQLLTNLKEEIEETAQYPVEANPPVIHKLVKAIEANLVLEKDWEKFKLVFEGVHPTFFALLQERYPSLTPKELKLAALLKLNFSSKDISSFLGISEHSVKIARYRLRKKLQLSADTNLVDFLLRLY